MTVEEQVEVYIAAQPEAKRNDLRELHGLARELAPESKLWFLDGRNDEGKIVSNPNIGYGLQTMTSAGGKTREFYRVGLSANTTGISIYIMGVDDKTLLSRTFGERLGKASITGYCIKFKALDDVDRGVVEEVLRFGLDPRH